MYICTLRTLTGPILAISLSPSSPIVLHMEREEEEEEEEEEERVKHGKHLRITSATSSHTQNLMCTLLREDLVF